MSATRARRLANSAQRSARALVSAEAPASTTGIRRRGRDVHLDAHGTDRVDKIDHPADFSLGVAIVEAIKLRPRRKHEQTVALRPRRDAVHSSSVMKGHEGMQDLQDFIERPGGGGAGFILGRPVGAGDQRLGELDAYPRVAIDVPDEAIGGGVGRVVEAVHTPRSPPVISRAAFMRGSCVGDPAVERFLRRTSGSNSGDPAGAVELDEARGVPQLRSRSCADCSRRSAATSRMSWPCAAPRARVKRRSASAPSSSMMPSGSTTLPSGLRHLGALLVADADGGCRRSLNGTSFAENVQPHHHHAGNPEEDDVEAGDQRVGQG